MKCNFCESETNIYLDLRDIPFSVTSDSRIVNKGILLYKCESCSLIQKNANEEDQKDYFDDFISHSLSDGEEQIKFIDNIPYPRSELIINSLRKYLKKEGSLIDIGTGNGSFIKSFKKNYPEYNFFAQDIQNNSSNLIYNLIIKDNFFLSDINQINQKFDLISLIHVLGHIPNIKSFLQDLRGLSKKDSKIIIQTPDLETSFFDIVIIDQISHFSKFTLQKIVSEQLECNINFINSIDKEITLITNTSNDNEKFCNDEDNINLIAKDFEKFIRYLYNSKEEFILFGSSPSSSYLAALIKERLLYFVDEDESKINKIFLEKTIKKPPHNKIDSRIVLPFLHPKIIENIKSRYSHLNFLSIKDI